MPKKYTEDKGEGYQIRILNIPDDLSEEEKKKLRRKKEGIRQTNWEGVPNKNSPRSLNLFTGEGKSINVETQCFLLFKIKRKTNAEASVLPNIISAITHRLCPLGSLVRPPTNLENSNDFLWTNKKK